MNGNKKNVKIRKSYKVIYISYEEVIGVKY